MKNKVYSTPILEVTRFDVVDSVLDMPTGPGDVVEDPYSKVETTIPDDLGFGDL